MCEPRQGPSFAGLTLQNLKGPVSSLEKRGMEQYPSTHSNELNKDYTLKFLEQAKFLVRVLLLLLLIVIQGWFEFLAQ